MVRPFSLGLRLFVAMIAGHILMEVFGSFIVSGFNGGADGLAASALLSFLFIICVTALELLVCAIQAYVFALADVAVPQRRGQPSLTVSTQGVITWISTSAQVIGAGLAAIGVGAAAIGVGNVFGSFLESALRNPAAADGQQGRLFIGFAAAELLGLIAFAVAMIILYAPLTSASEAAPPGRLDASDQPASRHLLLAALLAADGVRHHLLRHRPGDGAEDPVDGRRCARRRSPTTSRPPQAARAEADETEEAYRERMDESRAEAAKLDRSEAKQASAPRRPRSVAKADEAIGQGRQGRGEDPRGAPRPRAPRSRRSRPRRRRRWSPG